MIGVILILALLFMSLKDNTTLISQEVRKYYVDVYTGQSIVEFEFYSLDSALQVIKTYVVQSQTISIYSYKLNPYKHGSENIFKATRKNYPISPIDRNLRVSSFACLQGRRRKNYDYR